MRFNVDLPIAGATIVKTANGNELWLSVVASGRERDREGDRFSAEGLNRLVSRANRGDLKFLDGHHRDILAGELGKIQRAYLTKNSEFALDVKLFSHNPFAVQLWNEVKRGVRHGASIAGILHKYETEEYGNGSIGRVFSHVELLEVSRTGFPAYQGAFCALLGNGLGKSSGWGDVLRKSALGYARPAVAKRAFFVPKNWYWTCQ